MVLLQLKTLIDLFDVALRFFNFAGGDGGYTVETWIQRVCQFRSLGGMLMALAGDNNPFAGNSGVRPGDPLAESEKL